MNNPDDHRTLAAVATLGGGLAALSLAAVLLNRAAQETPTVLGAVKFGGPREVGEALARSAGAAAIAELQRALEHESAAYATYRRVPTQQAGRVWSKARDAANVALTAAAERAPSDPLVQREINARLAAILEQTTDPRVRAEVRAAKNRYNISVGAGSQLVTDLLEDDDA